MAYTSVLSSGLALQVQRSGRFLVRDTAVVEKWASSTTNPRFNPMWRQAMPSSAMSAMTLGTGSRVLTICSSITSSALSKPGAKYQAQVLIIRTGHDYYHGRQVLLASVTTRQRDLGASIGL